MDIALITGSAGLIGAEAVRFFPEKEFNPVGIDNDMRAYFFGQEASTEWSKQRHLTQIPGYEHYDVDIRNRKGLEKIFQKYGQDIKVIIHTAAQPAHDWAAQEPFTDFEVNATGTLNLLEMTRLYCPEAVFIFTSTSKVYGDTPNRLPLVELSKRWEVESNHPYYENGIDEQMSIDQSTHSLFGASKVAADILVQEYGRYFGLKTGVFRGGCLTGPGHSSAELHGFLAYLMKCAITGKQYTIFGYGGKQVRDNIHAWDLVNCFYHFFLNPRPGEVYNIGGSRHSNCSILEGIELCEQITGAQMKSTYSETNRIGDHIWYISDIRKFREHYPNWEFKYSLDDIFQQIHDELLKRQQQVGPKESSVARN